MAAHRPASECCVDDIGLDQISQPLACPECGDCAGGLWRARQEMGHLLRSYDCSCADRTLLTALSKAGCADVAAMLAANPQASKVCAAELAIVLLRFYEGACASSQTHYGSVGLEPA